MDEDVKQKRPAQQDLSPLELTQMRVVYDIPGTAEVIVRRDLEFCAADGGVLPLDLYLPASNEAGGSPAPVVIVVAGYPDTGTKLPCKFKELGWTTSWGRLIAASGLAAVTYSNRAPAEDLDALLSHLRQHADALGIDAGRMALSAASGNVPLALSALMHSERDFRCAALSCGFMLDLDGTTWVAEAAAAYGFVNPCAGRSVTDLSADVPLLVARAGRDQFAHLNETLDRFLVQAVASNLPVSFVNHATSPHAFDLFDDSDTSREIIRRILSFLEFHLRQPVAAAQSGAARAATGA